MHFLKFLQAPKAEDNFHLFKPSRFSIKKSLKCNKKIFKKSHFLPLLFLINFKSWAQSVVIPLMITIAADILIVRKGLKCVVNNLFLDDRFLSHPHEGFLLSSVI